MCADLSSQTRSNGFTTKIGDRLLRQPDYAIERCPETGLLLRVPSLDDSDLDYYYANNDWRTHCFPRLFPTEKLLHKAIVSNLPAGSAVLDIGCGDGRLLSQLPATFKKYGTELSEGAANAASDKGVRIVRHEEVLAGQHGLFDAILMVDVFEHLRAPHDFIAKLMPVLKPGGLLGIATGDGDFCLSTGDAAGFWYWGVPVHLTMMTEAYARYAESRLGLGRVSLETSSHYPPNLRLWSKQVLQKLAYEFWHDGKHRWLGLAMRGVPLLRRAKNWKQRPVFWYGRDHVVIVWSKGP